MAKEETKKDDIDKEDMVTHKEKFRCKKCGEWKPKEDARPLIVSQRNRPLEFEHVVFTTKTEVIICKQCYKLLQRS